MQFTRQHQIYAGVLGLGCLALIADRTLFAPEEAAAVEASEFLVPDDDTSADPDPLLTVSSFEATLSKRLADAAENGAVDPQNVPDAFRPAWHAREGQAAPRSEESPAAVIGARFNANHRLTAVMGSGRTGYAIVDGKCIRVGQSVDEFTLSSVGARSATFAAGDVSVTVEVELDLKREPAADVPSQAPGNS